MERDSHLYLALQYNHAVHLSSFHQDLCIWINSCYFIQTVTRYFQEKKETKFRTENWNLLDFFNLISISNVWSYPHICPFISSFLHTSEQVMVISINCVVNKVKGSGLEYTRQKIGSWCSNNVWHWDKTNNE